MSTQYVVAEYTHGSFRGFADEPGTLEEARAFVANPPSIYEPRPQDSLAIFELVPVYDEATP